MSEPQSPEEYLKLFNSNQRIEGHGIGNVFIHTPCPFCAAPDFIVYELLQVEEAMSRGAVCKNCSRGCRAVFDRGENGVSFSFVQTEGPDAPAWLTPAMPRGQ